eukprot:TRINITY_DN76661_c0_g1_i1.p1 TRINITY_DN76661_c0_g1~~TRINITY_DN76661_c0_g1_i1.p1  ORF type:complete len:179 (+),score=53.40 TRINITY_DN76661_c0_g1_i1:73-609(+)
MSCQGKLKSYNSNKGFGFIVSNGTDIFFHKSELKGKPPKEGDTLYFDTEPSTLKPGQSEAKNVTGGTLGGNLKGKVKWYNDMKGYGFIEYDNDAYFMHASNITGGTPMEGDEVWFDLVPSTTEKTKMECKEVVGGSGYPMNSKGGKGWGKGWGYPDPRALQAMMMMSWAWGGKGYKGW